MTEQPRSPACHNDSPEAELAIQQHAASWDALQPDFERRFRQLAGLALRDRPEAGEITLILADDALQRSGRVERLQKVLMLHLPANRLALDGAEPVRGCSRVRVRRAPGGTRALPVGCPA